MAGMVTVNSPPLYNSNHTQVYTPFNRDFIIDLFDAVKNPHQHERRMRNAYGDWNAAVEAEGNRFFDELEANQSAVESGLRRRFILPGPPCVFEGSKWVRRVTPILSEMQGEESNIHRGFPRTLIPEFIVPGPAPMASNYPNNWQRINLADSDLRYGWAKTVAYNPLTYYDEGPSGGLGQIEPAYDRRHLVTTVNYSDDLARKQETGEPKPKAITMLDLGTLGSSGSTYEGELKFYLGEVAKAFREVDAQGNLSTGTGWYSYDTQRGNLIIQRLAALYYDMLRSYSDSNTTQQDWGDVTDDTPGSEREAVSRRQQAFMLAVNTVAFAAPRSTSVSGVPGFIPVVSYADVANNTTLQYDHLWANGTGATDLRYNGYAPQPFFTEAIAYQAIYDPNSPSDEDDPNIPNLAIAYELFNPNDPYYDGTTDTFGKVDLFGVWLGQFAVSVNGANPNITAENTDWHRLAPLGLQDARMNGRSFVSVRA